MSNRRKPLEPLKRPAHATYVNCRDWPHRDRWAWRCTCGAGQNTNITSREEAQTAAAAHTNTTR